MPIPLRLPGCRRCTQQRIILSGRAWVVRGVVAIPVSMAVRRAVQLRHLVRLSVNVQSRESVGAVARRDEVKRGRLDGAWPSC